MSTGKLNLAKAFKALSYEDCMDFTRDQIRFSLFGALSDAGVDTERARIEIGQAYFADIISDWADDVIAEAEIE